MNGWQIKKSLQTPNEAEAYRRANLIWHEQGYRLKQGLAIEPQLFCKVAEKVIRKIEFEATVEERSRYHPIPDTSISGRRIARELTALLERRGKPGMIVSDHGTEFRWALNRAGKADAERAMSNPSTAVCVTNA